MKSVDDVNNNFTVVDDAFLVYVHCNIIKVLLTSIDVALSVYLLNRVHVTGLIVHESPGCFRTRSLFESCDRDNVFDVVSGSTWHAYRTLNTSTNYIPRPIKCNI